MVINNSVIICSVMLFVLINIIISRNEIISVIRFSLWCCGSISGLDEIILCNLLKVIIELVNVIVLINIFKNILVRWIFIIIVFMIIGL